MLHDERRNAAYVAGIEAALRERPGAAVLDIGAGSGLLALVAAGAGARHVTAVEMVQAVAAVASLHVRAAALQHTVHVLPILSLIHI
eukprot:2225311-Rhodomonas_salina.3